MKVNRGLECNSFGLLLRSSFFLFFWTLEISTNVDVNMLYPVAFAKAGLSSSFSLCYVLAWFVTTTIINQLAAKFGGTTVWDALELLGKKGVYKEKRTRLFGGPGSFAWDSCLN